MFNDDPLPFVEDITSASPTLFGDEPFPVVKGVVLERVHSSDTRLWTTLFTEGEGIVSVASKNLAGSSEPFVWGYFSLQKKAKSRNYFLFDADIKDDMFRIRRSKTALLTAMNWAAYLRKYLVYGHPDDELLSTLYWCMKLLTFPAVPPSAAEWRLLRLWLEGWGLAPDLVNFHADRGFNGDEIALLYHTAALSPQKAAKLFTGRLSPNIRRNVFKVASTLALGFFDQI